MKFRRWPERLGAVLVMLIFGAIVYGIGRRDGENVGRIETEARDELTFYATADELGQRLELLKARMHGIEKMLQVIDASWYGPGFHGRTTASGEVFDENAFTFAHPTLPFGTRAVFQFADRAVIARCNDRGPYFGARKVDLSKATAAALGIIERGVAPVRMTVLQ